MGDRFAEIAPNIYCLRVSPTPEFTYNSFLIVDERPTLIHTGRAKYFDRTHNLLCQVLKPESLAYIAFSHFEGDECGALKLWLEKAPNAVPVCSPLARASVEDLIGLAPKCMHDGDVLRLGTCAFQMIETPHFPHGWDAGVFYERHHKILFSSDIGAQPGDCDIVTDRDVSGEALRFQSELGFMSEGADFKRSLDRVCQLELHLLATQHGSVLTSSAAHCFLGALKHHVSQSQRDHYGRKPTRCDD